MYFKRNERRRRYHLFHLPYGYGCTGNGIKPSIKDGYIVSDGTTILGADDKAGLAVMLETLKVLKEQNIEHGTIEFIITVGEESGLVGAKALDRSL